VLELKKRLKKREKSGVNELFNIIWTGLNKLRLKRGVGCRRAGVGGFWGGRRKV